MRIYGLYEIYYRAAENWLASPAYAGEQAGSAFARIAGRFLRNMRGDCGCYHSAGHIDVFSSAGKWLVTYGPRIWEHT
jgi:hypothetical protein